MVEPRIAPRALIGAMVLLQLLWLAASWAVRGAEFSSGQNLSFLICSALLGLGVFSLPEHFVSVFQKLKDRLLQNEKLLVLALCAVVFVAGVIYARYNKIFLDEPEHFNASKRVAQEGVGAFFAAYSKIPWLGKQHPPLVPLMNGFAMAILGVNLFVIRLVTLAFSAATLVVTYFLGKELYDRDTGLLTALIFLAFPFFLCLGAAALTDVQVTFFFSLAMLLTLRLLRHPTYLLALAVGLAIGLGILTKYTMILIFPVLLGLLLMKGDFRRLWPYFGIAILVSFAIGAPWVIYCWQSGVLALQKETITRYSKVVTGGPGGRRLLWGYLLRGIPRGLGPYNIPMLLLGGVPLLQRRDEPEWFLFVWIVSVFLFISFTLPDPRYFMPIFPPLAVVAALGLRRFPESQGKILVLAWLFCAALLFRFAVTGPGMSL